MTKLEIVRKSNVVLREDLPLKCGNDTHGEFVLINLDASLAELR